MPQFSERFSLDLADAFAGYGEVLADLFQRVLGACISKPETHLDDFFLAGSEGCKNFIRYLT